MGDRIDPLDRGTYLSLQNADLDFVQSFAGLVAVANILKGFGGILTGAVKQNLLTATTIALLARDTLVKGVKFEVPQVFFSAQRRSSHRPASKAQREKGVGLQRKRIYVRVLVHKLSAVVDLVMDHDINVLLGVVLGNILVGKLDGGRHDGRRVVGVGGRRRGLCCGRRGVYKTIGKNQGIKRRECALLKGPVRSGEERKMGSR